MIDEFLRVVAELAADRAVRAVILTGRERRFCAGADIAMLQDLSPENQRRARRWVDVQAGLEAMEKPVVAAINGYALGGGAELALACDVRLMARGGEIGFPEIRLGFFPGAGGTQRLTRLVGPARALRLMMEGRRLTADEARALGLVDEVVPADLLPQTARDVAERLASGPHARDRPPEALRLPGVRPAARRGPGARGGGGRGAHPHGGRAGRDGRLPREAPAPLQRRVSRGASPRRYASRGDSASPRALVHWARVRRDAGGR